MNRQRTTYNSLLPVQTNPATCEKPWGRCVMKDEIWPDWTVKILMTDKNTSSRQLSYEHIGAGNLINRKIFNEKQCFSTAC